MFDTIVKIILTLAVAGILIAILPASPFSDAIASIGQLDFIGYANWFFPLGQMTSILAGWATCMGLYYAIAWILRQLNIVSQ